MNIVKFLKWESSTNSKDVKRYPQETDPATDYIAVKGVAFNGDATKAIEVDSSGDIVFKDATHKEGKSLKTVTEKLDRVDPSLSNIKIWRGTASVNNGGWSVDYTSAGFTAPPTIFAQAECTGTSNGDANYASVRRDTITTTGCSGRCSNAVSGGLLAVTVNTAASNGTIVEVLAIGI